MVVPETRRVDEFNSARKSANGTTIVGDSNGILLKMLATKLLVVSYWMMPTTEMHATTVTIRCSSTCRRSSESMPSAMRSAIPAIARISSTPRSASRA